MATHLSLRPSAVRKYLTFRVARQDFAMDAARVKGILPVREMVPLEHHALGIFADPARLEDSTCGFASLQGRDFPVIDLRARLDLPHGSQGRQPCIVVVEVATERGPQLAGFVADRVSEVVLTRQRDVSGGKLRNGGRPRQLFNPDVLSG